MDATLARREPLRAREAPRSRAFAGRYGPLIPHGLLLLLGLFTNWFAEDPATTLYVTGIAALFVCPFLILLEIRRAPLGLSPLSFYFGWYTIVFGPAAIHHANKISNGILLRFTIKEVYPDELAAGYLLFLFGSLCLHAGMQLTRPLPKPGEVSPPPGSGFVVLWALGPLVRIFGADLGSIGAFAGMLQWASLAALTAYVIHQGASHKRAFFWFVVGAGTIVEFVVNLRAGSKAYLMFSFLPIGLLFARERALRRWFPVFAGALAVLYLVVIAPVISAARTTTQLADETQGDRIVRTYAQGDYSEGQGVTEQAEAFFERAFEPTPAGFLYGEVERGGHRWGETMEYLAYAFIPRLFWPDKPGVSRGAWFYAYVGAARTESEATTSIAQTAAGELYWNFGFVGVVLGLGLLGSLFGLLWRLATPFPEQDPVRLLLYVSLVFNMIDMSEAGSTLVNIVFRALVLLPAMFLLGRAVRKMRASPRKRAA
jgi:hypothetical protein